MANELGCEGIASQQSTANALELAAFGRGNRRGRGAGNSL
jgi:hypothetical protein